MNGSSLLIDGEKFMFLKQLDSNTNVYGGLQNNANGKKRGLVVSRSNSGKHFWQTWLRLHDTVSSVFLYMSNTTIIEIYYSPYFCYFIFVIFFSSLFMVFSVVYYIVS